VQEREKVQLNLGNYFKGSLLNYEVFIEERNATAPPADLGDMVMLVPPFDMLSSQDINDTSYKYGLSPFPRSTYIMQDKNGAQTMYFLDRNLAFMKYDISNYTEKNLSRGYSYQLNTSALNYTCRDLQAISSKFKDYMIIMCDTVTFSPSGERKVMTTLARIENPRSDQPVARYISYTQEAVIIDPDISMTYLGCEFHIFT